jgi:hypothetical protein
MSLTVFVTFWLIVLARILCVEIARREAQKLTRMASAVDERCVVIVHDIRRSDFTRRAAVKVKARKLSCPFL